MKIAMDVLRFTSTIVFTVDVIHKHRSSVACQVSFWKNIQSVDMLEALWFGKVVEWLYFLRFWGNSMSMVDLVKIVDWFPRFVGNAFINHLTGCLICMHFVVSLVWFGFLHLFYLLSVYFCERMTHKKKKKTVVTSSLNWESPKISNNSPRTKFLKPCRLVLSTICLP